MEDFKSPALTEANPSAHTTAKVFMDAASLPDPQRQGAKNVLIGRTWAAPWGSALKGASGTSILQSDKCVASDCKASPVSVQTSPTHIDCMASRREKGRAKGKSRKADMEKKRREIAELQRKLKEMIDKRNGNR